MYLGLGKLDDQDGILGGQAQYGQQADLEIDIIGQSTEIGGQDTADDPQRQRQHDRDGQ